MAQVYECGECGNILSISDGKVIYAAYCKNDFHEMQKVSDSLADRAVAEAEEILKRLPEKGE